MRRIKICNAQEEAAALVKGIAKTIPKNDQVMAGMRRR